MLLILLLKLLGDFPLQVESEKSIIIYYFILSTLFWVHNSYFYFFFPGIGTNSFIHFSHVRNSFPPERICSCWVTFPTSGMVQLISFTHVSLQHSPQQCGFPRSASVGDMRAFAPTPNFFLHSSYYLLMYCVSLCYLLSCVWLCVPVDCNPPNSSVHGILQARIPEWVAICFSRGSSQARKWTWVFCIAGEFFTIWAIRESYFMSLAYISKWRWK